MRPDIQTESAAGMGCLFKQPRVEGRYAILQVLALRSEHLVKRAVFQSRPSAQKR